MSIRRTFTVLLVEDHEISKELSRLSLKRLEKAYECNIQMTIARNGDEAITFTQHTSFDLIIMDVRLPKIDGLKATQIIRAIERETNHKSIIIGLSAFASPNDKIKGINAGMDYYLTKPASHHRFLITLTEALCKVIQQNPI